MAGHRSARGFVRSKKRESGNLCHRLQYKDENARELSEGQGITYSKGSGIFASFPTFDEACHGEAKCVTFFCRNPRSFSIDFAIKKDIRRISPSDRFANWV